MGFSEQNSANAIQARLWKGFGKVARQQGVLTEIYRPVNALAPFGNKIGETQIVFTNNYEFIKPDKFGVAWLYAIFDGTLAQHGDYLVSGSDTFYIATIEMNSPPLVVRCERTVSVSRVSTPTAGVNGTKGVLSYAGATRAKETTLVENWKASILQGTKGESNPTNLPSDVRMPWWLILMPSISGITFDTGDIIRDDQERKFLISSAELTRMGWRLTATYERA